MASTPVSEASDGPVLSFVNKRLRALKKKLNRIHQMEESISQGKSINKEQEEVLKSKPSVVAIIDELEKLRSPLSAAVSEEISLAAVAAQRPNPSNAADVVVPEGGGLEDLLNLLYFASLFDVKSQSDFTATMWTRTHERGCCLSYDYVTDDATDLLGEGDLDLISKLGGLLVSRPVDSSLSHKNALQRCIEHAAHWINNSGQTIEPDAEVTYAGLREKLRKIMASDYFTTTPQLKASVEMAAAAAAGNYAPFEVHVQAPGSVAVQEQKDEGTEKFEEHEAGDNQPTPPEEIQKEGVETEQPSETVSETVSVQTEEPKFHEQEDVEHNHREVDHREVEQQQQYNNTRRPYNHRGGRGGPGGGRRGGYPNGRGSRGSGRGGGGYQNGRNYEQPGNNYYPRNYYNNSRGRGGGGAHYNNNNNGGYTQQADVGVSS